MQACMNNDAMDNDGTSVNSIFWVSTNPNANVANKALLYSSLHSPCCHFSVVSYSSLSRHSS